jgi:hypothetical protein
MALPVTYDALLVLLALPLAVGYAVSLVSPVALAPALAAGGVVSTVPLSYALFVAPPIDRSG